MVLGPSLDRLIWELGSMTIFSLSITLGKYLKAGS